MNRVKRYASLILGLALISGIAYFSWQLLSLFAHALVIASPAVTAAVIGGIATISVGLSVTLYTQTQIKQREADESHRSKKVEIYERFLRLSQRVLEASNDNLKGNPIPEEELIKFMVEFKTDLILWSGSGVINAFRDFEKSTSSNAEPQNVLPAVDRIYREMRKDIGLSNRGLPPNQLIKLYLNNPEELDEALSKASL